MMRVLVMMAALLAAPGAFAQAPAGPPQTFALVQEAQNEQMTGFVEVSRIEPDTSGGAGLAHVWMLTVLRDPVRLPSGLVDAVWTYYEVGCGSGEFARVTAFHITAGGDVVDSSGAGQRRQIADGSPISIAREAACNGGTVGGERITDLPAALAVGRAPR